MMLNRADPDLINIKYGNSNLNYLLDFEISHDNVPLTFFKGSFYANVTVHDRGPKTKRLFKRYIGSYFGNIVFSQSIYLSKIVNIVISLYFFTVINNS